MRQINHYIEDFCLKNHGYWHADLLYGQKGWRWIGLWIANRINKFYIWKDTKKALRFQIDYYKNLLKIHGLTITPDRKAALKRHGCKGVDKGIKYRPYDTPGCCFSESYREDKENDLNK